MLHHARLLSLAGSDLSLSVRCILSHTQLPLTCPPGPALATLLLEVARDLGLLTAQDMRPRVEENLRTIRQTLTEVTGILMSGTGRGKLMRETELPMTTGVVDGAVVLHQVRMVSTCLSRGHFH